LNLIFVYNAKAGVLNGVMDSIHKMVSPDTYECDLCAITYGLFAMNKHWRAYLKSLPMPAHFYHKPDFEAAHPALGSVGLPIIGLESEKGVTLLLNADAIKGCPDVNALISTLDQALADCSQYDANIR
jgi:hypothetical protein